MEYGKDSKSLLYTAKCANHSKGYSAHSSLQSAGEDFSSPKVATGPASGLLVTQSRSWININMKVTYAVVI